MLGTIGYLPAHDGIAWPQGLCVGNGPPGDGCGRSPFLHWTPDGYPPALRRCPRTVPSVSTEISTACVYPLLPAALKRVGGSRPRGASSGPRLLLDAVGQLRDLVVDRPTFGHQRADLTFRVHDGGVVAAAE